MPKARRKKADPNEDLYHIRVGTAGIGRTGFRAYFNDERIDRSDGDDLAVFDTPGQALAALGKKLDEMLISQAWHWRSRMYDEGDFDRKVKRGVIKELYEEEEKL